LIETVGVQPEAFMDPDSLPPLLDYLSEVFGRISVAEAIGYLGIALAVGTSAMRTMIPLRSMSLAASGVFLVYGLVTGVVPTVVVNAILLPLNAARLVQMIRLVREVKRSAASDLSIDWLKPFMNPRTVREGEVLFRKGEEAACLFYTLQGRFRLRESDREIPVGQLVGEIAFVSPDRCRTQTLECMEAGAILTISYDDIAQLYHQNPSFGFYFLKLTSARLLQNIERLEAEVAALRGVEGQGRVMVPAATRVPPARSETHEPQGLPSAPSLA
jgi:CRP-like cAMP-binding protein